MSPRAILTRIVAMLTRLGGAMQDRALPQAAR